MPPRPRRSRPRYLPIAWPIKASDGGNGRERALPALAAPGLRAAPVPQARGAARAVPPAIQLLDAPQGRFHLARSRAAPAGVHLRVEGGAHVRLQRLEGRL